MDFSLLRRLAPRGEAREPERFDDVLVALRKAPRLAVLGNPGAGKSFALMRIAAEQANQALDDAAAPLPLFVPLKEWVDPHQPLDAFIAVHSGVLSRHWSALLEEGRLHLLLDGLNELPTAQRADKMVAIRRLVQDPRLPLVVVSCRRDDFVGDLHLDLDTLDIRPLDPPRIYTFITRYLTALDPQNGAGRGKTLFWHLAGGEEVRATWAVWRSAGATFEQFWTVDDLAKELPEVYSKTSGRQDQLWRQSWHDPRSLLRLAANPFLLRMMVEIGTGAEARLPDNRARLFEAFVGLLLARENARHLSTDQIDHPGLRGLETALGALAWALQRQAGGPDNVQLALPIEDLDDLLSPEQLKLGVAASLLEADQTARFTHQLLQEYFTALGMRTEIERRQLRAEDLWPPDRWWQRTGWEEATVFMAGLAPDNPVFLAAWLTDAQPRVLVQCIAESGCRALSAEEMAELRLPARWRDRIDSEAASWEPAPEARHAVALALGRLGLDDRQGIGLGSDGLPEIDWVDIPGGDFLYGESKTRRRLEPFLIARYPITNAQYQAFIDAGGYREDRWWQGLAERIESPSDPSWAEPSRPRERVTWYEAVAFCRWLCAQRGSAVRLPTEEQWERAARGTDGREYPWGDGYRAGYANINETWGEAGPHRLDETSVVGLYPEGRSPEGVQDLAGNVWEWCLNEYEKPERIAEDGDAARVLRGGSWPDEPDYARAAFRYRYDPDIRHYDLGFRVVCSAPIR